MENFSATTGRGLLMAGRYAFMPNKLHYCGGDNNARLFDYSASQTADLGLAELLSEFEAMYPYLKFIAEANHLADPFEPRVVEAYWIGNELLENIPAKALFRNLTETFQLNKKIPLKVFNGIIGQLPAGALPHHSFHVFNTWRPALGFGAALQTIESCLITWGKITAIDGDFLTVTSPSLTLINNQLAFTDAPDKKIRYKFLDKTFIPEPKINDGVSCHWGWACEKLTDQQLNRLKKYTLRGLNILPINLIEQPRLKR